MIFKSSVITNKKAATILESMVAIGLLGFFILIFGASYTIVTANTYLRHKNLAYHLAAEEIEAIRNTHFSQLTNRTNADFIEVAYNKGSWAVTSAASAPSSPNVYKLASVAGNPSGLTGLAAVPGFDYDDFTFETKVRALTGSPANWQVGIYFRYHDKNNYYRASFDSSNLYLDKKAAGAESSLDSKVKTFLPNTWYTLKVVASDNSFEIYINDILELSATDDDSSFSKGRFALLGMNSVHAQFDDLNIINGASKLWNFDSDTVGKVPSQWNRFSLYNLTQGTDKLTIEDNQPGFSDIKQVTARVEWKERGHLKSVELITLITQ